MVFPLFLKESNFITKLGSHVNYGDIQIEPLLTEFVLYQNHLLDSTQQIPLAEQRVHYVRDLTFVVLFYII